MAQLEHSGVVVRYTQRHLNVQHTREYALEVQEHARRCFEVMKELMEKPGKMVDIEDAGIALLALWHDAVNTSVSVYYLIGWDANLHRMWGVPDDVAWLFAQERGWPDAPDFGEWVAMRLHLTHILQRETTYFPLRETLPVAYPPKGSGWEKRYIHTSNFQAIPDDATIKRFDQFLTGLVPAVFDWYTKAKAEADKEAEEWFEPEEMKKRRSKYTPFSVSDRFTHCPPRQVEKRLIELTRDVSSGRASSRYMAGYRYVIKKAIRESGALMARFKLDHLNADLSSRELALSRWSRYVEARLEALDLWMKEAGGGSTSKVMQYTPDRDRYFDILADVCAKHRVRP